MEWFYAIEDRQMGPVGDPELARLLRYGVITPATLVWRGGMDEWVPYSALVGMPPIPELVETTVPIAYAGFWIRWLAYALDFFVLGAFRKVEIFPMGLSLLRRPFRVPWFYMQSEDHFYSLLIGLCYFVFFWTFYGATPGKMVLRLKVVSASGGPVGWGQAVGRYFGQMLSGVIFGIGFLMAGFDGEKRALHDRLAKTRVIRL